MGPILQLISECHQSGLADNAWCDRNDINVSTFYNAVTRLRKKACDIPQPAKATCNLVLTSRQDVVSIISSVSVLVSDGSSFVFEQPVIVELKSIRHKQ